jgi:hypothetical protein
LVLIDLDFGWYCWEKLIKNKIYVCGAPWKIVKVLKILLKILIWFGVVLNNFVKDFDWFGVVLIWFGVVLNNFVKDFDLIWVVLIDLVLF